MNKPKFIKSGARRFKKLSDSWRRPKGRDNKLREKIRGKPRKVETGYRSPKDERGKIRGTNKRPILVKNLKEADKIKKGDLVIVGRMGKRKRLKMIKKVGDKGGKILNNWKDKKSGKKNESKK